MATYVLIHGAGSDSWYWNLVAPELRARGHAVVGAALPAVRRRFGRALGVRRRGRGLDRRAERPGFGGPIARRVQRTPGMRTGAGAPPRDAGGDGPVAGRVAGRLVGQHGPCPGQTRARRARQS